MQQIDSAQNQKILHSLTIYMLGVYEGAFNCCERHVHGASQFPVFLAKELFKSVRFYVKKQALERYAEGYPALEGDELAKFGAVHLACCELMQDMDKHARAFDESITWGDELHASLMNGYKAALSAI